MAKTIADYKKDYAKAYKARDYNGMRNANNGANEIRRSSGQKEYSSAVGDAQRASNSNRNTNGGSYTGGNAGGRTSYGGNGSGYSSSYDSDIQSKIEALNEAKKQSTIDGLTKAKDNALAGLDKRKSTLEPYYYDKKNQVAARSDVGTMNFAQYMASRGVTGNAAAMPEMYSNANFQNQIGALDRQQLSDISSIESDKSNIETNYQSDIAAAKADAEATKLQNYINQMNADRAYNTEQSSIAKNDFANTMGSFSSNYKAEINRIDSLINAGQTHDTDGVSLQYKRDALNAKRNEKISEQEEAALAAKQQEFENQLKKSEEERRAAQTSYNINKPYYNPKSNTSSSSALRYNGYTKTEALSAYNNGITTAPVMQALKYFYDYEE